MESYNNNQNSISTKDKRRVKEKIFPSSDMGEYRNSSFQKWQTVPGSEKASIWTKRFVEEIKQGLKPKSLLIWGDCGNGKTELMACAYNSLDKEGFVCVFTTATDLVVKFFEIAEGNTKYTEKQMMNVLKNADAIFIDDFAAETYNQHRIDKLFLIFDMLSKYKIPVIMTMNHFAVDTLLKGKTEDEKKRDPMQRVISRIRPMFFKILNTAPDYREYLEELAAKEAEEIMRNEKEFSQ